MENEGFQRFYEKLNHKNCRRTRGHVYIANYCIDAMFNEWFVPVIHEKNYLPTPKNITYNKI